MNHRSLAFSAAILSLAIAACGGKADDGDNSGSGGSGTGATGGTGGTGATGGTGGSGNECSGADIVVKASRATNYEFSSTLTIGVTPVQPRSELSFDWSGVGKDLVGHAVDPLKDIDMVTLLLWNLSEADLATKMNDDALAQADMEAIVELKTEGMLTAGGLFDFTSFGEVVKEETLLNYLDADTFDPATHSYTLMAASGTTAGQGTRMIQSFRLDSASTNTAVVMDSDSTKLDYTANLTDMNSVEVSTEVGSITVDWAGMTVNAMGNEFDPTAITDVLVAKYSLSRTELEEKFLDLETLGDDLWRGSVPSGTSMVLSSLENEAGEAFAGIDDSHTWVVALFCGACANPAPWYLAVLESCSSEAPPRNP